MHLPDELTRPRVQDNQILSKLTLDLTLYLTGPTLEEFEYLVDLYHRLCPKERIQSYAIMETPYWLPVSNPTLTMSGRAAANAGSLRPYLEPVRNRIREGRAFRLHYWDGNDINNPAGCWSFTCGRVHKQSSGHHTYVQFMLPLSENPALLEQLAIELAEHIGFYSGHGGLSFTYNTQNKYAAFDAIYACSRRFWGIDIENLNGTLTQMQSSIKGISWLTLLGEPLLKSDQTPIQLDDFAAIDQVLVRKQKHGALIRIGDQPNPLDQHRPASITQSYGAVASLLDALYVKSHPDFEGYRFIDNGDSSFFGNCAASN